MPHVTDKQYYMSNYLLQNLDILKRTIKRDMDHVILITGSGKVRIGKSILAQQVGYYLSHGRVPFTNDNIVFRSDKLIDVANKLPKYSVIVYDEAREGLESTKTLMSKNRDLLDFFAECGQLNLFVIIVLPDFFDLKKSIAITRSTCLLNVYFGEEFNRGYFSFFNDKQKKELYLKGKQWLNYTCVKPSFRDKFFDVYTVDKEKYKQQKRDSLKHYNNERKKNDKTPKQIIYEREQEIIAHASRMGYSQKAIGEFMGMSQSSVQRRAANELNDGGSDSEIHKDTYNYHIEAVLAKKQGGLSLLE